MKALMTAKTCSRVSIYACRGVGHGHVRICSATGYADLGALVCWCAVIGRMRVTRGRRRQLERGVDLGCSAGLQHCLPLKRCRTVIPDKVVWACMVCLCIAG